MSVEHNFLIGKGIQETDKDLFFGPLNEKDELHILPDMVKWLDILVDRLQLFSSRGQARKANPLWAGDIPDGWTDVVIGKKRIRICILKIA